jgi:hypothetical protein
VRLPCQATDPDGHTDCRFEIVVPPAIPPGLRVVPHTPPELEIQLPPSLCPAGVVTSTLVFDAVADDGRLTDRVQFALPVFCTSGSLIFINEIVPATSRIEIHSTFGGPVDLTGWTVAGYTIGSNPALETYVAGLGGPPTSRTQFQPFSFLVIDLPAPLAGSLVLQDPSRIFRDEVDPTQTCYAGGAGASLARRVPIALANPCVEFEWRASSTLGGPN